MAHHRRTSSLLAASVYVQNRCSFEAVPANA